MVSLFQEFALFWRSRIRSLPVYLPLKLGCNESNSTRSSSVLGVNSWLMCRYLARISSPRLSYFLISSVLADSSLKMRERWRYALPSETSGHLPRPAVSARSTLSRMYRLYSTLAHTESVVGNFSFLKKKKNYVVSTLLYILCFFEVVGVVINCSYGVTALQCGLTILSGHPFPLFQDFEMNV